MLSKSQSQLFSNMENITSVSINYWRVFSLFTRAIKSSYIDKFVDRSINAFEFTQGLQKALNGSGNYNWFLS